MSRYGVSGKKEEELEQRMLQLCLKESEIEESFIRSSGPGGQHVNKSATCVQLFHKPSGIEVKCQKSRSQALNRFYARRLLCEKLEEATLGKQSPKQKEIARVKKQKARRTRRQKTTGKAES